MFVGRVFLPPQLFFEAAIYAVNADGTGLRRLTADSLLASRPSW